MKKIVKISTSDVPFHRKYHRYWPLIPKKYKENGLRRTNYCTYSLATSCKRAIVLLLCIGTSYAASAQVRQYGTKDFTEFLKITGREEKTSTPQVQSIHLPLTLSLTFVLFSQQIKPDQLTKQVAILNEDFSNKTFENAPNKNPFYKNVATDTEIRFCEKFEVIEAYTEQKMTFSRAQEYVQKVNLINKGSIPIFICDLDSLAGFAQAINYSSEKDAIFLDINYVFGSTAKDYELGKTLTHLIGSYLGLGELWNCEEDGITDTPQMSSEHFEQESGWSSCYRYVVQTMPENFMYNTKDMYLNMFTLGQKERMLRVLATERAYLVESSSCEQSKP